MRSQLVTLRSKMKERGIDLYIVPTTDYHGSEYVNDYFKCREYISGFTGSAGTLVVQQDFAGLWTDGRYFLQAREQLQGSGITLMKTGEPDVPEIEEYIKCLPKSTVIGFDGRIVNHKFGSSLKDDFAVICDGDLVGEIWEDRPKLVPSEIYELNLAVTGETSESKINRIRQEMGEADYLLVSRLEDIAWLYNLRGRDIANTPVFYAFALISETQDILYVMDETFILRSVGSDGCIKPYGDVFSDLKQLTDCIVMLDEDSVSYGIGESMDASVKQIL